MTGAHFQTTIDGWPDAIRRFPSGTLHKSLVDQHLCRDIMNVSRGEGKPARTVFRWPVPNNHYDPFLNRPNREGAKDFFSHFVDTTFLQLAAEGAFTAVETVNEVYGNGMPAATRQAFVNLELDCVAEWASLQAQHPELRNIKLCLANTAIGNDIPDEIAEAAYRGGHYIGYHSYIPVRNKEILPGEWQWYSGRFAAMDARWRARGWFVKWMGTEGGPVGYHVTTSGAVSLHPDDGWRHPEVCDRDMASLLAILGYWLQNLHEWNAAHGNRHLGKVLFTSNRDPANWRHFRFDTNELAAVGDFMAAWGPVDPPDPPPPPPPPQPAIRKYSRTAHLLPQNATEAQALAVAAYAYPSRQTVLFSADDGAINPNPAQAELTGKALHVWGEWPGGSEQLFREWLNLYYAPLPSLTFHPWAELPVFTFDRWPTRYKTGGLLGGGINQVFGANPGTYAQYGLPGHEGIDLHSVMGDPIYAVAPGVVHRVHTSPTATNYGINVRILHDSGYQTISAHLSAANAVEGQTVKAGDIIGFAGNSGNSAGPHLHLTLKLAGAKSAGLTQYPNDEVDPWPYMLHLL